jgi:hypothetical protein
LTVAGLHVPVTALLDVVGSAGAVAFWHKGPICVNAGVTDALIVMLIVAVVAQPDDGVKVYTVVPVVAVFIVAGVQVPATPLLLVAGSAGAVEFWHKGPICVNAGVTDALIVMLIVAVVAQPDDGVKVYTVVPVVAVFIVAGVQVPVTPLLLVAGSAGAVEFWHKGPICVNAGVTLVLITMSIVTVAAHDTDGVNVYVAVPVVAVFIVAGVQVPVTPLLLVTGSAGAVEFWHSGPICVNAGVTLVLITMSIVTVAAHDTDGVNVYVVVPVVAVFIVAGVQVPVTPLLLVTGSAGAVEFWHKGPICVNAGVTDALIVMLIVAVVAQPDDGVKVYTVVPVVAVFIVAGVQVPVTPLLLVAGSAGAVAFWHKGPICVNAGVTDAFIVMLIVAVVAQPDDGVKVYTVVPVVAVFIVAGVQVPPTPLLLVAGSAGAVAFWHKGPICVNAGVTLVLITMSIVTVAAHDTDGVNVYTVVPVVAVFIVAGVQVPVTPLLLVAGSAGAVAFWHSGPTWVNVGVTPAFTVISIVNGTAQPDDGVKV